MNRNLVPFLCVKNVTIAGKSEAYFTPVDAEYLNKGDNLEDLYKL